MSSNPVLDIATLKAHCIELASSHSKAVEILRKANGKDDYKKIAKDLSLHDTTVSGLLRKAQQLGLATKTGNVYKKRTGILGYFPTSTKKNKLEPLKTMVKKWANRKPKFASLQHQPIFVANLQDKPEKMAQSYLWLYRTENILRDLIRHVFGGQQDWWNNRVNAGIQKDVEDAIKRYPYDGAKRRDELEYTHLGQLKDIIIAKANWHLFDQYLNEKDKESFRAVIDKAIPYRNSIAHCTPLTGNDLKVVEIRFNDILKMIK
jgi:hypothetical protein